MKAIHGGKSKDDKIDSKKIAHLLRGGNLPIAYVYPKGMRETRDPLRRRMYLVHKRAEAATHAGETQENARKEGTRPHFIFFGRPRGRSVCSSPSPAAVCCSKASDPNGRARVTERRTASTSASVRRRLTDFTQSSGLRYRPGCRERGQASG